MLPGARGIFGALFGRISEKYDIPPIYVEWVAIFICWILFLIFEPSPFSSSDVIIIIFFYIASLVIYLIASIISGGNLDLLKNAFKKPSVEDKEFQDEIKNILKQNRSKKSKK